MSREKKSSESKVAVDGAVAAAVVERGKRYSREEIAVFLADIAKSLVQSNTTHLHSMLALNEILRLPYAEELFDGDLRDQARDLWLKIKSTGLQLVDPPLLFGQNIELPPEYDVNDRPSSAAIDGAG